MDPSMMGMAMMQAGNNPDMWGPILDQMRMPLPGSPEFQAMLGQGGSPIGSALMGPADGEQTGVPGVMANSPITPSPTPAPGAPPPSMQPAGPPPAAGPGVNPAMMPPGAGRPPQVGPQMPRMPTSPAPLMYGGVTGAQKAPDGSMSGQAGKGPSPAQMMMNALLGGQQNPLRVPTLGSILRGGHY